MIAVDITGRAVPGLSRKDLAAFARRAIRAVEHADAAPFEATELSIVLVEDDAIKTLNRKYRHRNQATDILTFGADPEGLDEPRPLGELVISIDTARRQARDERHSVANEVKYLVVHGILHAFGYDHEADRGEMHELELTVREMVGLT